MQGFNHDVHMAVPGVGVQLGLLGGGMEGFQHLEGGVGEHLHHCRVAHRSNGVLWLLGSNQPVALDNQRRYQP